MDWAWRWWRCWLLPLPLLPFKRWLCEHYSGITIALDCFKIFYVLWAHPASFIPFIFPQWSSKPFIVVVNTQRHTHSPTHSLAHLQWVCNVTNAREWKSIVHHKHTHSWKEIHTEKIHETRTNWLEVVDYVARRINAHLLSFSIAATPNNATRQRRMQH